jgi:hypothetical protein
MAGIWLRPSKTVIAAAAQHKMTNPIPSPIHKPFRDF